MSLVQYETTSKQVGKITLNDPDKLNAMGDEMAKDFRETVAKLKGDSNIRVLLLTGAGRAFSAGGDLLMLERKTALGGEQNRRLMLEYYHSFLGVLDLGIPIIAAINGHAIGAGLCLAAACEVRVCSDKAKLGLTFTKLGLHPGMGASFSLPRLVGSSNAALLMLSGRVIQADEAFRIGLVSKVVPAEKVLTEAQSIADEILGCGPEATKQVTATLRTGMGSLREALEREAVTQGINYASAELKEGVQAAIQKRNPKFGV